MRSIVKIAFSATALLALLSGIASAKDAGSCKTVRFSDVGWTDITATTAAASEVMKGLGYMPKTEVLSVPVTFTSMKNKKIGG